MKHPVYADTGEPILVGQKAYALKLWPNVHVQIDGVSIASFGNSKLNYPQVSVRTLPLSECIYPIYLRADKGDIYHAKAAALAAAGSWEDSE